MDTDRPKSLFRLTRRGVVLAVLAIGAAAALAVYLDVAEIVPAVGIPCLAWLTWRWLRVSATGLVLWAISLDLMTLAGAVAHRLGGDLGLAFCL